MGAGDSGRQGEFAADQPATVARSLEYPIRTLLRKRFRLPFRCRGEVNRGQQAADEHYQQIDFHVTLRCGIAALTSAMQKAFRPEGVPALCNDIDVIKNG